MSLESAVLARPSRRTLAKGAAWSIPTLAVATATPALAASTGTECPSCLAAGGIQSTGFTITANASGKVGSATGNVNMSVNAAACKPSFYKSAITLSLTKAIVYLTWGGTPSTFGLTYTLSSTTTVSLTPGSATNVNFTGNIVATSPTYTAGLTPPAQGSYADGANITQVCMSGTYSYTGYDNQTHTGSVTVCETMCTMGSQLSVNSNTSWSRTGSSSTCSTSTVTVSCP